MKKLSTKVRVAEADTVSDILVRLHKESNLADEYLDSSFAEVEKLSAELTTAIKSDKVLSTLDEADIKRDEIIKNLGNALTGYASIPVAAKESAAEKLLLVFGKYGKSLTSKSYAEESSLIESMLEDFSADDLKSDIVALDGISELLSSLRTAQNEFNKANDEFTAANVGKGENATSLKKKLVGVLNDKVVVYLEGMSIGNKNVYGGFASLVEAEIDKANSAVNRRTK